MRESQVFQVSGLGTGCSCEVTNLVDFCYSFIVYSEWKGNSDRGLIDCEYSGKGG